MTGRLVSPRYASWALTVLLVFLVGGCAPRNTAERAPPHPAASVEHIYVATQRRLDQTGRIFGQQRGRKLSYFRASVSVPPTHRTGHVEWPEGPPDAATDFVVTGTRVYEEPGAYFDDLRRERNGRESLVFVHGYNNTLSDSMYRLAQIQADFDTGLAPVLFSWASAGDPRGYIYDRDSVLFARDDLEELLKRLTEGEGGRVLLLAHSMGSHLVMEVLRQAALRGDRTLLNRISGVVLMSPDIDPDLFRRQAETIGQLPQPFLIFVSRQDKALNFASLITGSKPRLGVIDGPTAVEGLDVRVIDFTALSDGEGLNHSVAATSPAAISVLKGMIGQAQSGGAGFENYMVLSAQP